MLMFFQVLICETIGKKRLSNYPGKRPQTVWGGKGYCTLIMMVTYDYGEVHDDMRMMMMMRRRRKRRVMMGT